MLQSSAVHSSDQLPPSLDALTLHWLHSVWMIDYWRQANLNHITLLPMEWFGWVTENGMVKVEWDAQENLESQHSSLHMDVAAKQVALQPDANV